MSNMPEVFTKSPGVPKPPETRPNAVWRTVEANLFGKPHKAFLIDTPHSVTYISPSALTHQIHGTELKEGETGLDIKGVFATSTPRESDKKIPGHNGRNTRFVVFDLSQVHNNGDIRFKVVTSPFRPIGSTKDIEYFLTAVEDVPSDHLIPQVIIGQPLDWRGDERTAKTSAMSVAIHSLLIVTGEKLEEPDAMFPELTDLDPAYIATNRIPKLSDIREKGAHSALTRLY